MHMETETSDDSDESCKICKLNKNQAPNLTEWISCDGCKKWLHRSCADLHFRWKKIRKTLEVYAYNKTRFSEVIALKHHSNNLPALPVKWAVWTSVL